MSTFSNSFLVSLLLIIVAITAGFQSVQSVSGEPLPADFFVFERFIDETGCEGKFNSTVSGENNVNLNWIHGAGSSLAGQQRADKLGADACSQWRNGESFENASAISPAAELTLNLEIIATESSAEGTTNSALADGTQAAGLLLKVEVNPLDNLPDSLNLRWYITVDHTNVGESVADDVVLNYGWSSSFYHDAGNITNWTQVVDANRLAEDGIPFSINDLWRLEVTVMLVDDLNHSIVGVDSKQVQTPSRVPAFGGMFPIIILTIAVIAGLAVIIRQDYQREVGLPRLKGTLRHIKNEWVAEIEVTAGKYDLTLKGASANIPWKMSRAPKQQLVTAGTSRNFTVKLRCSEEITEAETFWEVEVEELGGWVMDLKLPIPKQ